MFAHFVSLLLSSSFGFALQPTAPKPLATPVAAASENVQTAKPAHALQTPPSDISSAEVKNPVASEVSIQSNRSLETTIGAGFTLPGFIALNADYGGRSVFEALRPAPHLSLKLAYIAKHKWGMGLSLDHDFLMVIENGGRGDSNTAGNGGETNLFLTTLGFNVIKRWNSMSLEFGPGYTLIQSTHASSDLSDFHSFLTLQANGSYWFADQFAVEFGFQLIGVQARPLQRNGTDRSAGDGVLFRPDVLVKYAF
jgi:hypothetical protein